MILDVVRRSPGLNGQKILAEIEKGQVGSRVTVFNALRTLVERGMLTFLIGKRKPHGEYVEKLYYLTDDLTRAEDRWTGYLYELKRLCLFLRRIAASNSPKDQKATAGLALYCSYAGRNMLDSLYLSMLDVELPEVEQSETPKKAWAEATIQPDGRSAIISPRYSGTRKEVRVRVTPPGQPTVADLVKVGDFVRLNKSGRRKKVIDVVECELYDLPIWFLYVVDSRAKPQKAGPPHWRAYRNVKTIGKLVAQDRRIVSFMMENDKEVFLESRTQASAQVPEERPQTPLPSSEEKSIVDIRDELRDIRVDYEARLLKRIMIRFYSDPRVGVDDTLTATRRVVRLLQASMRPLMCYDAPWMELGGIISNSHFELEEKIISSFPNSETITRSTSKESFLKAIAEADKAERERKRMRETKREELMTFDFDKLDSYFTKVWASGR
jgi:hypothetical protein